MTHGHRQDGRAFFVGRLALAALIGAGALLATWQTRSTGASLAPACTAEAVGKKCACPVMSGETILMPCSSQLDPTSCGVCSVMSTDGKRDGRSCVTIQ